MVLAIIGSLVTTKACFMPYSQSRPVRLTLITGILVQVIALGLGAYSRRTKAGKAAIWITALFYLAGLILMIVARSIKFQS